MRVEEEKLKWKRSELCEDKCLREAGGLED